MITGFETYIRNNTNLGKEDIEKILAPAQARTLQRNELLLQQGQICRHKTFLIKGLMRTYGIVEDGSEHILHFSTENTWVLDAESYNCKQPSLYNIAAINHCEILCWTQEDFNRLLSEIPELNSLSMLLITSSSYNVRNRLFSTLSATPEEKYNEFTQQWPDLLSRLPLHMIASYLGISLKTLTRIRHAQLHR
ncbi:cyclic nucleotide-binding domain-containing protein [Chitinophaga silvatica]|uniref:Cyclic nucleotide-binding domain-containing protein n=1 Tax=Chitinophaga silvatica TaxID=2282649 RepID=A0A3E1YI21_9BACT|nr:cyclic nucleotide-binding domain-containing protein [Chitinophaga silvatica]RFS27041.1 cyclic nucleotide-binding domain-containing protein [Chitinophaga silvatica]